MSDFRLLRYHILNLPAWYSDTQVLRDIIPMLRGNPRPTRRLAMQFSLEIHHNNRSLFNSVMGGGWNYTGMEA